MPQCVRVPAAEPDNPRSVPRTNIIKGENQLLKVVQHMQTHRDVGANTGSRHTLNKQATNKGTSRGNGKLKEPRGRRKDTVKSKLVGI